MKNELLATLLVLVLIFGSCGKENTEVKRIKEGEECSSELLAAKYPESNSCCISGYNYVYAGEELTYTYARSTQGVAGADVVEWTVVSGDITIVDGQGTSNVKLKFGDNFTEGEVSGLATDNAICEAIIVIELVR